MKFKIEDASFSGFCGGMAAISQGRNVRLFHFYDSAAKTLMECQHSISTFFCKVDEEGEIWIEKAVHPNPEFWNDEEQA